MVGDVVRDISEQRRARLNLTPQLPASCATVRVDSDLVSEPRIASTDATLDLRVHTEPHVAPKFGERFLCGRGLFEGEIDGGGPGDVGVAACSELREVFMGVEVE